MIRNLEAGLGIPAAILVQEYDLHEEDEQKAESSVATFGTWDDTDYASSKVQHFLVARKEIYTQMGTVITDGAPSGDWVTVSGSAEAVRGRLHLVVVADSLAGASGIRGVKPDAKVLHLSRYRDDTSSRASAREIVE